MFLSNHIDEVKASYDRTGVFPSVGSLTHPGSLTASQIEDGHRRLLAVLIECGSTTCIEAVQELFRMPVTELALGGLPINENEETHLSMETLSNDCIYDASVP